jgi:Toprim domain-containing protein
MTTFADLGIVVNPHGAEEQRGPCPQCDRGARDEALGVNVTTGAFHCFRCGWKGRVGGEVNAQTSIVRRIDDPEVTERKRERLRRTWKQCVALTDPAAHAVRSYLESRALGEILKAPPKSLRAHPGLEYWDNSRNLGKFPAMVALFQASNDDPVTLHVTWLRSDGSAKAAVPVPKKTLSVPKRGATKGGAIRLYAPRSGVLGVAEGIESALSLHLIRRIPVWSARCADGLEHIQVPKNLRRLEIGVDIDPSGKGQQVAQALASRIRKYSPRTQCFLVTPEVDGSGDLNDELRKARASGKT